MSRLTIFIFLNRAIPWTLAAILTIIFWLTALAPALAQAADASHPLDAHLSQSYVEDLDALLNRKNHRPPAERVV